MSTATISAPALAHPWSLWHRQALATVRVELRKHFITKRGFWVYLLALAPAAIVWLHSFVTMNRPENLSHDMAKDTQVLATLFQAFFLSPAVYFGCVGIFSYLFRGEVVERSLHYYFLAPVRRELLVLAKYAAGVVTSVFFFGVSLLLTFAGMYAHFSSQEIREFLFNGAGLNNVLAYLLMTVLACIGWGSVCLWMGIRFRNPIIPSVLFLGWESANLFLPSWLRNFSVMHYLNGLAPVYAKFEGASLLFGAEADRLPAWVCVPAILAIAAAMLVLSMYQLKRTEISYSTD